MLKPLLDLQQIDTALLQLIHRLARLEERTILATATTVNNGLKKELIGVNAQLAAAKKDIETLEVANHKCESSIAKYAQQLKTIIAPREAEALQNEIATATAA